MKHQMEEDELVWCVSFLCFLDSIHSAPTNDLLITQSSRSDVRLGGPSYTYQEDDKETLGQIREDHPAQEAWNRE